MRRKRFKLTAIVLCFCLLLIGMMPVYAANESNTLGVTFQAELNTPVIMTSDQNQTVVMRVNASQGVTLEGIGAKVVCDSPLVPTSIVNEDSRIEFSGSVDSNNSVIAWDGTDNLDQLENVTNIAVVTFTVPANIPAGTYTVGLKDIELSQNYGEVWESSASASAVLTIEEAPVVGNYSIGMSTLTNELSVGEQVAVNLNASHSSDTVYAAGEIVVRYDNTKLKFNQTSSNVGTATVKDENGTITLENYGTDKNWGNGIYVLTFDAVANGQTDVTLASGAFVNKENAVKSDLIPATVTNGTVSFTINKKSYPVTLPDIFTGESIIVDGGSYTFMQADGDHYIYSSVTATVNGNTVDVVDHGDGTYTISNVTGPLVITGSREGKTYQVTYAGNAADDITDKATSAAYNVDYSFTMPSTKGWVYSLESIVINGSAYSGYSVQENVYTIPGTAILGDMVITVNKVATEASVYVEGNGASAAAGYNSVAQIGSAYTLTIAPEAGYFYTVTATMGGETVSVSAQGNTYTIENVTGDIVFTVTRDVVVDGVSVAQYLTLDGAKMWLIRNETTLAEGKTAAYDGEKMFWSDREQAYCYLVIADTLTQETAKSMIGIIDGEKQNVDYGMDVNLTGKVDASDAQLIYNMYNTVYNAFSQEATVEKFLRADVNGDDTVNVEDAAAVVTEILK